MNDLQGDVKNFNQLHPNRKLAVFGIILFAFIVSVLLGVYFTRNREAAPVETGAPAATTQTAATTDVTLVPSAESVAVGEIMTVSVMLDGEAVQASDIVVNYDSSMFAASNIVNGDVFDIVRQDIVDGVISVTLAVDPANKDDLKTGELFSFDLEALKAGTSELTLDQALTITAKNGDNTLRTPQGVSVSVR